MLEPAREHQVTIQPATARRDLRERHTHLKRDARLLGQDENGADRSNCQRHQLVQLAYEGLASGEVMVQIVEDRACVRLVPVREGASALRAAPERAASVRRAGWRAGHAPNVASLAWRDEADGPRRFQGSPSASTSRNPHSFGEASSTQLPAGSRM